MNGTIYKIINTVNGNAYIGQTIRDVEHTRVRNHLTGHGGSPLLTNAVKKYGRDAFTCEILHEGIIPEMLDSFEIEAIKSHNTLSPNGYNLHYGGQSTKVVSTETRRKLSKTMKGNTNGRGNKGRKGKRHSLETRLKMSNTRMGNTYAKGNTNRKGKRHSLETRRKISEAKKRYWAKRKSTGQEKLTGSGL